MRFGRRFCKDFERTSGRERDCVVDGEVMTVLDSDIDVGVVLVSSVGGSSDCVLWKSAAGLACCVAA